MRKETVIREFKVNRVEDINVPPHQSVVDLKQLLVRKTSYTIDIVWYGVVWYGR